LDRRLAAVPASLTGTGSALSVMPSTVPVKAAAAIPAALHGDSDGPGAHEQAQTWGRHTASRITSHKNCIWISSQTLSCSIRVAKKIFHPSQIQSVLGFVLCSTKPVIQLASQGPWMHRSCDRKWLLAHAYLRTLVRWSAAVGKLAALSSTADPGLHEILRHERDHAHSSMMNARDALESHSSWHRC
jgi:hypothetical protein